MNTKYRINGAVNTRWYNTQDEAWEAYCKASERAGLPYPMHAPGAVCGDATDCKTGIVYAVRNGHGTINFETRKVK